MKTLKPLFSILILSLLVLSSCTPEDESLTFEKSEVVDKSYSYTELENGILQLVNQHREDLGLNTLERLDIISNVALSHTNYMISIEEVNHDNFLTRQKDLVENASAKSVGENVAYGFNSAQGVVNAWIQSDNHRQIIEDPTYTHFGISTDSNFEGRNYFTQIFIQK